MRIFVVLVLVMGLCACQPQEPTLVLPTVIDLNALSTTTAEAAVTFTALAATLQPATLPPTWTPSPVPSVTPLAPTAAEEAQALVASGMIYYIYGGDSLARVPADGSREPELILLATGMDDLTLSPDGTLLAYVAQGSGSAREVFIANLDGTYNQKISCLGLSRVVQPKWSWDNTTLAFLASQTVDSPLDIYTANVAGSNNCPTGNDQRQRTQLASANMDGLTWSADGARIYFTNYNIGAVELESGLVYDVTIASGWGRDRSLFVSPYDDMLYFLRPDESDRVGGQLFVQDISRIVPGELPQEPSAFLASYFIDVDLSRDGEDILLAGADGSILILSLTTGSPITVAESLVSLPPQPVFSPDAQQIAYIGLAAVAPQIYIVSRVGGAATVITNHTEGTVEDIVWVDA